jgi:hypothetical protein
MVLTVIDTQAHTQRTVTVPVKAGILTSSPAQILAYKPRS